MSIMRRAATGLDWGGLSLFAVAFFVSHAASLSLIGVVSPLAPTWPPAGVAVAALVLLPAHNRAAIYLLVVLLDTLSNVLMGYATPRGFAYLVASLIEISVTHAILLKLAKPTLRLTHLREVPVLALATIAGTTVSGVLAALITGSPTLIAFANNFAVWWIGDLLGIVLVAPFAIVWLRPQPVALPSSGNLLSRGVELLVYSVLLVVGSIWCFRGDVLLAVLDAHPYMLTLPLIWAALRYGTRGVTVSLLVMATIAVVLLVNGQASALEGTSQAERIFRVQVYLGLMAATGLLLSTAIVETRAASEANTRSAEALVESERRLRQSQKMDAIGQLAGGIAHDFNNILAAMLLSANEARRVRGLPAVAEELLLDIEASAKRAAGLTQQLLLFSRKQSLQPQSVDLNEIVQNMARLLGRVVPANVSLTLSLSPEPLLINADAGMLEQVLMNLVVNARDAMPEGGGINVCTWRFALSPHELAAHPEVASEHFAGLRVTDTGTGIGADDLPHVFEPFFSTKEQGKGTGLGLSTVFGIAQQHHGFVRVASTSATGTSVEFCIPTERTSEAQQRVRVTTPLHVRAVARDDTVLIVEDDAAVRRMLQRVLERDGFSVVTAETASEALDRWESYDPPVDLVLTDLVMPGGVSGIQLAVQLRARNPLLPFVFTSGYDPDQEAHRHMVDRNTNFIPKPSTAAQVLRVVHANLAGIRA